MEHVLFRIEHNFLKERRKCVIFNKLYHGISYVILALSNNYHDQELFQNCIQESDEIQVHIIHQSVWPCYRPHLLLVDTGIYSE